MANAASKTYTNKERRSLRWKVAFAGFTCVMLCLFALLGALLAFGSNTPPSGQATTPGIVQNSSHNLADGCLETVTYDVGGRTYSLQNSVNAQCDPPGSAVQVVYTVGKPTNAWVIGKKEFVSGLVMMLVGLFGAVIPGIFFFAGLSALKRSGRQPEPPTP